MFMMELMEKMEMMFTENLKYDANVAIPLVT